MYTGDNDDDVSYGTHGVMIKYWRQLKIRWSWATKKKEKRAKKHEIWGPNPDLIPISHHFPLHLGQIGIVRIRIVVVVHGLFRDRGHAAAGRFIQLGQRNIIKLKSKLIKTHASNHDLRAVQLRPLKWSLYLGIVSNDIDPNPSNNWHFGYSFMFSVLSSRMLQQTWRNYQSNSLLDHSLGKNGEPEGITKIMSIRWIWIKFPWNYPELKWPFKRLRRW